MGGEISVKKHISAVGNPLKHGEKSAYFQEFLKKNGLDNQGIDIFEPDFATKVKLKLDFLNEYSEQTKILLSYYKSTGARGLSMLDRLVNLKSEILAREKYLKEQGIDPLTDRHLKNALESEFEIVKFLEKIKYDREKTELVMNVKNIGKTGDDIAFIRED